MFARGAGTEVAERESVEERPAVGPEGARVCGESVGLVGLWRAQRAN